MLRKSDHQQIAEVGTIRIMNQLACHLRIKVKQIQNDLFYLFRIMQMMAGHTQRIPGVRAGNDAIFQSSFAYSNISRVWFMQRVVLFQRKFSSYEVLKCMSIQRSITPCFLLNYSLLARLRLSLK